MIRRIVRVTPLFSLLLIAACGSTVEGSGGAGASGVTSVVATGATTASSGGAGGSGGTGGCGMDIAPPNEVLPNATDPVAGVFTMADALMGLPPGPGPLRAIIDTDMGALTCTMHDDVVPNGVANFIGLARGLRPWRDPKMSNKWVKRRFYDGLLFHRVIPGFVAQGGDPLGTGAGGPGYQFADELVGLKHHAGTLAYANSGPNTNGSQFYIAEKDLPSLDTAYVIFGECTPTSVVPLLTGVPTNMNDKPITPLHMKTVTITRCAP